MTLLEVLAAALIMAMVYGALSAQGLQGFELEGDAERRARASLLADRALADVEAALTTGVLPALGTSEFEQDEFTVRLEAGPFVLPLDDLLAPPEPPGGRAERPGDAVPSLFAPAQGQAAPILSLRIVVTWWDGVIERSVERTTFALDPEAVAAALGQSGLAGATDAEGNPVFGGAAGGGPGAGGASGGPGLAGGGPGAGWETGVINGKQRWWPAQ
jgi:hypothetical protein